MPTLELVPRTDRPAITGLAASDALLFSLGRMISTEISTSELLRRIVDVLTEILGADRGTALHARQGPR